MKSRGTSADGCRQAGPKEHCLTSSSERDRLKKQPRPGQHMAARWQHKRANSVQAELKEEVDSAYQVPSSCSCDMHITFAAGLLRSGTRPLRCRSSSLLLSCRLRGLQGQAAQSSAILALWSV